MCCRYEIFVPHQDGKNNVDEPAGKNLTLQQGGCYTVLIQRPLNSLQPAGHEEDVTLFCDVYEEEFLS